MSTQPSPQPARVSADITVDGTSVEIHRLAVDDAVLADLLAPLDAGRRCEEAAHALQIGARGITAMGAGLTLTDVGDQVERALSSTAEEAQRRVGAVLDAGRKVLTETLDPDARASVAARMVERVGELHGVLLHDLDPARAESHTGRFLGELQRYLSADGELDARLAGALDPGRDGSPMARLRAALEDEIRAVRDVVIREAGKTEEAARGTRKGFDFEETVEALVRDAARGIGGVVEVTSHVAGSLGPGVVVGDLVLSLPAGGVIAIEVKNTGRIGLNGAGGILAELDRAMANRNADYAVCVSAGDVFPAEVGAFGVYGNRVLVVDDGDGAMLEVALRWAQAALASGRRPGDGLDVDLVADRVERIGELAGRFSNTKRALAQVRSSIDVVRNDLDGMRTSLLDLVDEARLELDRATRTQDAPRNAA